MYSRMPGGCTRGCLADAFDLCVHLEPAPDIAVALRISERAEAHGQTAEDASDLELAVRTKSPLATFDDALAKAALAKAALAKAALARAALANAAHAEGVAAVGVSAK
jgi:hypothetical protein